eukprot:scaffold59410_cov68-Phaeocystis_antarctica.AAC.1
MSRSHQRRHSATTPGAPVPCRAFIPPNPEAAELSTDQLSPVPITRAGQARIRSGRRGCSQEWRAGAMRAGTSRQPACRPSAPQSHRAAAPASLQLVCASEYTSGSHP